MTIALEVCIVGHKAYTGFQGRRRDPQVIGRNRSALLSQISHEVSVALGYSLIRWRDLHARKVQDDGT